MNSKKKPTIFYLPRWYPNRTDPMPGLFIQRHAEVVSRFATVGVIYVHPDDTMEQNVETEESLESGVHTLHIYYRNPKNPILKSYKYLRHHLQGLKRMKAITGKPDLVHVHVLTRLGVLAMLYKWMSATPYVITEHWSRYLPVTDTFKGFWRKWFTKLVVKQASAVSTVTQNLMNAMRKWKLENPNYTILHNVVDTKVFTPGNGGTGHRIKRMIHVSCFEDRSKNISGLLNALSRLSEKRSDFECLMIGEGMDLEAMQQKAHELCLEGSYVHFTGLMEKDEIAEEMQDSDFLVMFSNYENFPVVINEAFACGLPVLATRVGGIPEHVDREKGLLVDPGDEKSLLEQLEYMLDNAQAFDRQKIRKYAEEHFSGDAVELQLKQLYGKAMKSIK
ncbi:MAG: glycosyltransferase [Bacteroidales bacterium]|nr:glycosyltransferase [Bacteroidales bacterium]